MYTYTTLMLKVPQEMGKKEHIQNQCLMVGDEGVLLKLHAGIGQGIKLPLSNGHNKAGFISTN